MEEKIFSEDHRLIMSNRKNINLTGVIDLISFDMNTIIAETVMGIIIINGEDLHVKKLNLDENKLDVSGEIQSFNYEDENNFKKSGTNILAKIFK